MTLAEQDEFDLGIDMNMMMTMIMMVVMVSVLQSVTTTSAQAAQTAQALQAQAYTGIADARTVHVTNILSWLNLRHEYPYTSWITAYFINDGPSAVEVGINYPDNRFTINPEETITVDRSGAQERISVIFFICRPGLLASMRVSGEY